VTQLNGIYQMFVQQWLKNKGVKEAIRFILQKAYGSDNGHYAFIEIEPTLDKYAAK